MAVYRIGLHLDDDLRFLGIRSFFLPLAGGMAGVALALSVVAGRLGGSVVGLALFVLLVLAGYLLISYLQARFPGRELYRYLLSGTMSGRIQVRSKPWRRRATIV